MTAATERHIHRACLEYLRLALPGAVLVELRPGD